MFDVGVLHSSVAKSPFLFFHLSQAVVNILYSVPTKVLILSLDMGLCMMLVCFILLLISDIIFSPVLHLVTSSIIFR